MSPDTDTVVIVESESLEEVAAFKRGIEEEFTLMQDTLKANGHVRESRVLGQLSDLWRDLFTPVTLTVIPALHASSVTGSAPCENDCFGLAVMDLAAAGFPRADALWYPDIGMIAVDANRSPHDGFAPYEMVHELVHVWYSLADVARIKLPHSWNGYSQDVIAYAYESWFLNGMTNGAYNREVRRIAREVASGKRNSIECNGATFAPLTPEISELFEEQGAKRSLEHGSAYLMFNLLATVDVNLLQLKRSGSLDGSSASDLYQAILDCPDQPAIDLATSVSP